MGKGIKHTNVGAQLTQEEFESETSHYLASGTSFPASPSEGDLFYRTDEHKWYIYNGTAWSLLTGDPTKVAGQASGLREEHGFSSQSLAAGAYGDVTVTFAVAFSNAPTVLVGFCYPIILFLAALRTRRIRVRQLQTLSGQELIKHQALEPLLVNGWR